MNKFNHLDEEMAYLANEDSKLVVLAIVMVSLVGYAVVTGVLTVISIMAGL